MESYGKLIVVRGQNSNDKSEKKLQNNNTATAYVNDETKIQPNNNTVTVYIIDETKTRPWDQIIAGLPDISSAELLVYL